VAGGCGIENWNQICRSLTVTYCKIKIAMRSAMIKLLPVCAKIMVSPNDTFTAFQTSWKRRHDLCYRDDLIIRFLESLVDVVSRQNMCA
jgi:hypothetical protein